MDDFLVLEAMGEMDLVSLEVAFDNRYSSINEFTISDIVKGIKDFIDKLIEKLIEFFGDLALNLESRMEANNLNKRLDALKDNMAKNRAASSGEKLNIFSINNYKRFYSDYINKYTLELKKGLNRDFNSISEYEKWEESMISKLSDFDYKITDEERWKLTTAVNSGIQLTMVEAQRRKDNLDMVRKEGTKTLKELQEYLTGSTKRKSLIEANRDKFVMFKRKDLTLKKVSSKIAGITQKVGRFISKHTIASILIILALIKIFK